jgi:hypothetical protein
LMPAMPRFGIGHYFSRCAAALGEKPFLLHPSPESLRHPQSYRRPIESNNVGHLSYLSCELGMNFSQPCLRNSVHFLVQEPFLIGPARLSRSLQDGGVDLG